MTNDINANIASTIIHQLCGGNTNRLTVMLGANGFTYDAKSPAGFALSFKYKVKTKNASNAVRITLTPADTYTVEFFSCRGIKVTSKGTFIDIYSDGLRALFEHETGAYLSL